ncbi:MAG TPA: universal stress protein [Burkholderiaceae bacterium]|nr:universal stress protein [Burkholderiaceae bacterium]
MIKRVLVGYDGSKAAEHAVEFAMDLAGRYGAELHVLSVSRPPDFGTEVETEDLIERGRRHCSQLLRALQPKLSRSEVAARTSVAVGHPSEQLLLYAEHNGIDHIVVGHRGRSGLARWLIGSVARQVIAYATCAVTVVRD